MHSNKHILVIDDEQVVLDAVKKILLSENFNVDLAKDATSALGKIEKHKYDIILCDIMMPEIDGFKFLDKLNHRKNDTPVIMTTGYSTVENAVNSLYKGAIDFIPKPFTTEELLDSIFRGMKYIGIQKKISSNSNSKLDPTLAYVPCPTKYFRLGYASWVSIEKKGSAIRNTTYENRGGNYSG